MADILTSNLYPPIIDTFMPAFTGGSCSIYFEISDFNTISDIDTDLVQVSLRSQLNNENCLENPNGIRYYQLQGPVTENGNPNKGKYYITISTNDLLETDFYKNQYYKVQIRFTKSGVATGTSHWYKTSDNPSLEWLNGHLESFSEWSTVCLIRKITEPFLDMSPNKQLSPIEITGGYVITSPFFHFSQSIEFGKNENEYLQNYRLKLYDDNEVLIEDSGIVYPPLDNRTNKVLYSFKNRLEVGVPYKVELEITSNNLYQKTFIFNNITVSALQNLSTPDLVVTSDIDEGAFIVRIVTETNSAKYASIYRTSNKSNFAIWDEIALVGINNSAIYIDRSVEAGTWYHYGVHLYGINFEEGYSGFAETSDPVSLIYEDVFLNSQGRQLRLRYDSHVTSYKKVVMENKTETLGSKFPIIRRNSATDYKQFALTGLITFHTDEENAIFHSTDNHNENIQELSEGQEYEGGRIFLTENEIYGGEKGNDTMTNLYHTYNSQNGINPYNDYVKEREFREKVIEFLNSGKVFLMRTLTEGLVLVRLMDINFTPNQSLNNYIYSFTATAIEVAECNPENYYKYEVFKNLYSLSQIEG